MFRFTLHSGEIILKRTISVILYEQAIIFNFCNFIIRRRRGESSGRDSDARTFTDTADRRKKG
jgi:hypothetical protein